jgi:biopolymer transport protein ExbD
MKIGTKSGLPDKIVLPMTPMIDIIFQMLIFFLFTFKIVTQEGDFNVKMPVGMAAGSPQEPGLPPIRIRLAAHPDGSIASIKMGDRGVSTFADLHNQIIGYVGTQGGPGSLAESTEVELDCDYDLRYEYVIAAITAVSGYVDPNNKIVKLIEKIKFSPPKKP